MAGFLKHTGLVNIIQLYWDVSKTRLGANQSGCFASFTNDGTVSRFGCLLLLFLLWGNILAKSVKFFIFN